WAMLNGFAISNEWTFVYYNIEYQGLNVSIYPCSKMNPMLRKHFSTFNILSIYRGYEILAGSTIKEYNEKLGSSYRILFALVFYLEQNTELIFSNLDLNDELIECLAKYSLKEIQMRDDEIWRSKQRNKKR
ncbi:hypothetical protein ACJX0J_036931, partial [Zea mays]